MLDQDGLRLRRRHTEAELNAVRIDLQRLQEQEAALIDDLVQIDALLPAAPDPQA